MAKPKPLKTRNNGQWTEARFRSFIKSALRGARWPAKYACIRSAYVDDGVNPKTGRKCKLHKCEQCHELFPQNMMQADHKTPVVGPEGFIDWNTYISRLYVEADGFRALCRPCHRLITKQQNDERRSLMAQ